MIHEPIHHPVRARIPSLEMKLLGRPFGNGLAFLLPSLRIPQWGWVVPRADPELHVHCDTMLVGRGSLWQRERGQFENVLVSYYMLYLCRGLGASLIAGVRGESKCRSAGKDETNSMEVRI